MSFTIINTTNTLTEAQRLSQSRHPLSFAYPKDPYNSYSLLQIHAHKTVDKECFLQYFSNKNHISVSQETFNQLLNHFDIDRDEYLELNKILNYKCGARYAGYIYYWNWDLRNQQSPYINKGETNYFFVIKNKRKFNYARLKFEF